MAHSTASTDTHGHPADPSKRDMLELLAGASAALLGAGIAWPLVSSMNPAKDVLALSSVEVDLAPIAAGQGIVVSWQGKPIFVRHRTPEEVKAAQDAKPSELNDPQSDAARTKPGHETWMVLIGICTHLGCIPLAHQGNYDGWFCPCHGSQYDTSGRIRQGPAPANLPLPPYAFISDTKIRIG